MAIAAIEAVDHRRTVSPLADRCGAGRGCLVAHVSGRHVDAPGRPSGGGCAREPRLAPASTSTGPVHTLATLGIEQPLAPRRTRVPVSREVLDPRRRVDEDHSARSDRSGREVCPPSRCLVIALASVELHRVTGRRVGRRVGRSRRASCSTVVPTHDRDRTRRRRCRRWCGSMHAMIHSLGARPHTQTCAHLRTRGWITAVRGRARDAGRGTRRARRSLGAGRSRSTEVVELALYDPDGGFYATGRPGRPPRRLPHQP